MDSTLRDEVACKDVDCHSGSSHNSGENGSSCFLGFFVVEIKKDYNLGIVEMISMDDLLKKFICFDLLL